MGDRAWGKAGFRKDDTRGGTARKPPRRAYALGCESLEGRELLAASLAPVTVPTAPPLTVPATLGLQVPVGPAAGATAPASQTYTVTSSNPDIKASVAQGKFVTFNVTHTAANSSDVSFSGPVTVELFNDLAPLTATNIENFVNQGFYNGKQIFRISSGFPGTNDFILQGGSPNNTAAGGPSGLPGTPFMDEFNPQLAFTGNYQLAMANSGPDTNDTQFFFTDSLSTPPAGPQFLDFHHTIFGQVVSGFNILNQMTQVAKGSDGTTPVNPVTITTATVSDVNPNGVIHVDATGAQPGETATVTVTATDPSTHTTATQTFQVTAAQDTQTERPYVNPVPDMTVGQGQVDVFRIPAVSPTPGDQLTYTVQGGVSTASGTAAFTPLQNATATVDQSTGIVRITPTAGFSGTINVLVGVRDQNVHVGATSLEDPNNYEYHQFTLTVNSSGAQVPQLPIAVPISQPVLANTPTQVALQGDNTNPGTTSTLTYAIVSPPGQGTVSQFNPATGTFTYTAPPNFSGTTTLQYTVTATGGGLTAPLTSTPATVTFTISPGNTGAVRVIGNVLVVTPVPRTDGGTNTILVTQKNDATNPANDVVQVIVNGQLDATQPLVSNLDRVVVYGSKASDNITVDPSVTVPAVTLDGGHGGINVLKAGSTPTREHGWYGFNTLVGGTDANELVGRAGHVKFQPTSTTDEIFAGNHYSSPGIFVAHRPSYGTFFKSVNGHLVAVPTPRGVVYTNTGNGPESPGSTTTTGSGSTGSGSTGSGSTSSGGGTSTAGSATSAAGVGSLFRGSGSSTAAGSGAKAAAPRTTLPRKK